MLDDAPGVDPLFIAGLIVLGLTLATLGILYVMQLTRQTEIDTAKKRVEDITTQIQTNPELSATLAQYRALDGIATNLAAVLNERYLFLPNWITIKSNVPKDVQFVSVSMGTDKTFYISGNARSVTTVANFAKALGSQAELTNVTPLSVSRQGNDQNTLTFSMTFKAKAPAGGVK